MPDSSPVLPDSSALLDSPVLLDSSGLFDSSAVLDEILLRLVEISPPDDDPTGASTLSRLGVLCLIHNTVGHQLATHAARLESFGVARRAGSTTRQLLIGVGFPPAVAARIVRIASSLGRISRVGAHSRDGRLAGEVVDAIARGMATIEKRSPAALSDDDRQRVEAELLAQALSGATPSEIRDRAAAIGNTIADDEGGIPACDDRSLDSLSFTVTDESRVDVRVNVTQSVGEKFMAMIDERSVPRPEPDGSPDPRSAEQRRADALEVLLDQAADAAARDVIGAPRSQTLLLIPADGGDPARMPWTGSVTQATARRLSCDGTITEIVIDGETVPLEMGRERRLFPPHIRKAVIVRDECCVACGAPPSHTQVHHIQHWTEHEGETSLDNGCLLCQRCHTRVHHNGWDVVLGHDRHPWLIPPADVDPMRTPRPAYNRRTMRLDGVAA
ncbi:HNH endonuclease [Gordonia paraffinivorans]|uniref:HNH endonuclease n=1 Tax=Gordonia paraffinivorans TaxID=175628 RepID=UPI001FF7EC32|nr:HNH endonuclease signature motif containing protein [Gordonia paraffinivorans]